MYSAVIISGNVSVRIMREDMIMQREFIICSLRVSSWHLEAYVDGIKT